jgi:hypothetical protein
VSVYTDPLCTCLMSHEWRWPKSSHMFADTLEELHAFAKRIGLRREWFQDKRLPHYDLNPGRYAKAVAAGVIELDRRTAVMFWRAKGWSGRKAVAS